ncbi:MAG TPA: hypothetical protein VD815_10955 [Candidatus Saccharimonadales bacterium]|nr:hypothetical protein [Candidatus Saccharimonadales bacterium]
MGFTFILSSLYKNPRIGTVSILIFIGLLFTDYYISSVTDVVVPFIQSPVGITFFLFLLIICIFGSMMVIKTVFSMLKHTKSVFTRYKVMLPILQIILYTLSAILLYDIIVQDRINTLNLTAVMSISYGSSVIMSFYFSFKLLNWYKGNRNRFALIFGLSIFVLFINNSVSIVLFDTLLSEKPPVITTDTPVVFNFECEYNSLYCSFKENIISLQSYTYILYFALFWVSNYFLLHYHIKKIGKFRFFTLITLPLVLFFFIFVYHYDEVYSLSEEMDFDEGIIFMIQIFMVMFSVMLCGTLYGLGFKSVASLLKISPHVERYLKMASYGIILLFISANATIVGASFPPYGIPSILFLPFASLLLYIGIYYSIIAISNDIKVRKYIKNSAYKELEIMGNLAQSQMVENMKQKVLNMTMKYSEELHQNSNSETMESKEDLRSYLDEAINVFNQRKKSD